MRQLASYGHTMVHVYVYLQYVHVYVLEYTVYHWYTCTMVLQYTYHMVPYGTYSS
jgi:hypothetical protein